MINRLGAQILGNYNTYFGHAVAISDDGNIIAAQDCSNIGPGGTGWALCRGRVRMYEWDGSSWGQLGNDIHGDSIWDRFGEALAMSSDGHTVAMGAYGNDGTNSNQNGNPGYVRIYGFNGSSWNQIGGDIVGVAGDHFGSSVSLSSDGGIVAIGAKNANGGNGAQSGFVKIYNYIP